MAERSVVVTGASTGIGRATALRMERLGWRVFAGVRKDADAEALTAAAGSDRLVPLKLDVTDEASLAAAAKQVEDITSGVLSGLVNNAGISVNGPLEYLPLDDLRRQFETNVVGQIATTQAFLGALRAAKGRIVMVGSVAGRAPSVPLIGPYSASKKALEALTDSLRGELKPAGVEVSIVEPGSIDTPIWDKGAGELDATVEALPDAGKDYYGDALRRGRKIAIAAGERGIDPDKVAAKIEHALTATRPRTRYLIGRDAYVRTYVENLIPDRLRDRAAAKVLFKKPNQGG